MSDSPLSLWDRQKRNIPQILADKELEISIYQWVILFIGVDIK